MHGNRKSRRNEEFEKKAIELYMRGMTCEEVSQKLSINKSTMYEYLKRNNVATRREKKKQLKHIDVCPVCKNKNGLGRILTQTTKKGNIKICFGYYCTICDSEIVIDNAVQVLSHCI